MEIIVDFLFDILSAIFNFYRSADFLGVSLIWFLIAVSISGAVIAYLVNVAHTR